MGKIWAVIELLRGLVELVKMIFKRVDAEKRENEEEKTEELNKAVDSSKAAQTDQEVWDAQSKINDNRG